MILKNTSILAGVTALLIGGSALAQGLWTVTMDEPYPVGERIAREEHSSTNNPDISWIAPKAGQVRVVLFDHDPKCHEHHGYVSIVPLNGYPTVYPVPTAGWDPGDDCNSPRDSEYTYRTFEVPKDGVVEADNGDTSGWTEVYFATNTPVPPTPVATATPEPPATMVVETPTPDIFATATPLPTATIPPVATATPHPTAVLPPEEPTATSTPYPTTMGPGPTPLPVCVAVSTLPPLPTAIAAEGIVVDIYVRASGAEGYTLSDGQTATWYPTEPLRGVTLYPNRTYTISVAEGGSYCVIGAVPTGLEVPAQPRDYALALPLVVKTRERDER